MKQLRGIGMHVELTSDDFHKHKFGESGDADIAIIGEHRALISITDGAQLVKKERGNLIRWLWSNKITMFHCTNINKDGTTLTSIFFEDFINFCLYERDIADNYNASLFLTHLVNQESAIQ